MTTTRGFEMTEPSKTEPITQEQVERLYQPVGEILVKWAVVDVTLDALAAEIFSLLWAPQLAFKWPQTFTDRLELIEEHLQERGVFGDLINTAKPIFDKIWHVKPLRDSIAHGVPDGYIPAIDAVRFSKVDRVPKEERRRVGISHRGGRLHVRFTNLAEACRHLYAIARGLNDALLSLRALAEAKRPAQATARPESTAFAASTDSAIKAGPR
jgi:hypothetical protein